MVTFVSQQNYFSCTTPLQRVSFKMLAPGVYACTGRIQSQDRGRYQQTVMWHRRLICFLHCTGDKPAAIHHKNTTSNSSSGSSPAHLPPVPLQVFLVGLLPLAVASGGGDLGRIISRTVAWWRAWGCTWLAASCWRWWDGHAVSTSPRSTRVR